MKDRIVEQERLLGGGHPTAWRPRGDTRTGDRRELVVAYNPPSSSYEGLVSFCEMNGESCGSGVSSERWDAFFDRYEPRVLLV